MLQVFLTYHNTKKTYASISSEPNTNLKPHNTRKFTYKNSLMMCIDDEKINGMRIISSNITKE